MKWSDETVEKVAKAIFECDGTYGDKAKAALAAVAECSEVKALVEAAKWRIGLDRESRKKIFAGVDPQLIPRTNPLYSALIPFTEASNG